MKRTSYTPKVTPSLEDIKQTECRCDPSVSRKYINLDDQWSDKDIVMELLMSSGLRRAELAELKISDLNHL